MNKYSLAGLFAAGMATAVPNYASALHVTDGGEECVRVPNSVCAEWLLAENHGNYLWGRLVMERWFDKDIYRVILKEGDTLDTALKIVKKVRPEVSIENLVQENHLTGNKLPPPKKAKDGKVEYGSLTYTVKVGPAKK